MEGFDLAESLMINKGSSDVTALYLGSELIWPPNYAEQYLTITALDNAVTVCFDYTNEAGYSGSPVNVSIEYSFDRTNWYTKNCKDWNYIITTLNKRQKLYIRGNNATYIRKDNDQRISYAHLYAYDGKYKLSGNIMSLVYGENFINQDTLTQPNAFYKLFLGASVKHAKNLIMPATTLTNYCYKEMFSGCQYLLTAPALPAISLTESCYNHMFAGCNVLTDAPELPATTLAGSCYGSMFSGCTNLINAPELPATTLAYGCYSYMFEACESLVTAPSLPATTLANRCYKGMFFGCYSLTTAPELPAMTLTSNCYEEMFYSCTSLTTAPLLSARTMVLECYMNMFAYCSSLNRIVCLATDISASDALTNWVYQVAESGTFTKHPDMTVQPPSTNDWSRGENGIPTRWLIDSAQGYVITDASTNGSVSAVPPSPLYGDVVTLTVSPDTGYESNSLTVTFNGNPVTVTNNQFIMPDGNVTVNGNFTMISYDVTVNSMTNGVIKSLKANGTTITPVNGVYSGVHYGETIDMEIYPVTNYDYDSLDVTYGIDTLSTSVVYSSPNTYRRFTMPASDVNVFAQFSALSDYTYQYLTLEGTGIIKILDPDANTLYYSINGSDWQSVQTSSSYTTIATLPDYNDCANRIRIRRTNVNNSNNSKWFNGSITKIFGNAMSFVAGDNFAQATTLTNGWEFSETFAGLTHLTDASNLILPATTLGLRSYYRMFGGDTSLTAVPSLPATNLGRACYDSMFAGCTSLTTAPALPATVLSDWCYTYMFTGCLSLTTAPILPASAMTPGCYSNMFFGCSLLDYVDVYATTMSDSTCTQNWLGDVAATGTVKKPSILNLTLNSPNGVPTGWSVNNVNYYTINTTSNVSNGTVTANPPAAQEGETVTLTLTPDLGYQDPMSIGYLDTSDWSWHPITNNTFTMPAANVNISCTFQVKSYSITTAPTSNGSVIANPGSTATYGSSVSVSDYPGSGYRLDTLQYLNTTTGIRTDIVNGIFTMPASDVVIEASFVKQTYTITIASGIQNGTITSNRQTAQVLDRVELTATPINSDYVLDTLTFTGVSSGETHDAYNNAFLMPPENVIVNGTFKYKYLDMYLTFESQSDNNRILWAVNDGNSSYNIYYSTDLDTWTQVQAAVNGMLVTTLNTGDKVYFKDMNGHNSTSLYAYFISTGNFKVYGNIMSLCYGIGETTIVYDYTFYWLFKNCTYLTDASKLVLPATTLAKYCYYYMFSGCTSLTAPPKELPATTLANYCYSYMFNGCSSLTTVPTLPATTLAEGCYSYMFRACSSLTTPPALPSTTLAIYCYNGMFYKCTSLTTVPTLSATTMSYGCYYKMFQECSSLTTVPSTLLPATTLAQACYTEMFEYCINLTSAPTLPATTLAQACYSYMFRGCILLTTAPTLPATTLAKSCYRDMFSGCTLLITAPELPATTLEESCYENMFSSCTNLNYVKVYATDISAQYCTRDWLNNVAATGTFTGYGSSGWTTGTSGIPTGWTFVNMDASQYLTIESLADNNEVYFDTVNSDQTGLGKSIEYSTDLTNWTSVTDEWEDNATAFITLSQGQKLYLRGTNDKYASSSSTYDEFWCTQNFSLSGNIMSLIYGSNFTGQTVLNNTYTFTSMFRNNGLKLRSITGLVLPATTLSYCCYYSMFRGCTGLTSIPNGLLPATTLATYCYGYMFNGCTGLTSIPNGLLPATTLTNYCYYNMFNGCTGLTSIPNGLLPATTLSYCCYAYMFYGCTGLTSIPNGLLHATTLADRCYQYMFEGCSSLTTAPSILPATTLKDSCYMSMFAGTKITAAPQLSATTLAGSCYRNMFYGCTSLTTAPQLSATTLQSRCYQHMFYGCTSLTTAPDLPAATLATYCYAYMFQNCSSLNSIKCLATNISASYGTTNWLSGVSSIGTFYKDASMTSWGTGTSGIPTGWTVVDV